MKDSTINRDIKFEKKKKGISTTSQIILGFFVAILVGAILLTLPIATVDRNTNFLTALFTSTTSVCVTGLVVVDTFSYWSLFGKIVILILIQLGGLGVVAFTSSMLIMFNKKVSLKDRMVIQDAYNLNNLQGMVIFVKKVILGTFLMEFLGTLLYMIEFIPRFGIKGIWYALFNSVSAFCNAGIDIIGNDSLMSFNSSPLVLITTMMLIFNGGIGFVVWWDFIDVLKKVIRKDISIKDFYRNLALHSRLVITVTFCLIFSGAFIVFILEYNNSMTIGNMSLGDKILNSLFQSVTLRTAGFAAINQGGLYESTSLIAMVYMVIGGSPVGTAGGIKTVTFAVLFFAVVAVVRGRNEAIVFNKSINFSLIKKSLAVSFISICAFFVFSVLLMVTNTVSLTDATFEVASAIATVGLSRGITASLNGIGQVIIIIAMYLGRIGPISMFVAFSNKYTIKNSMHYAEADIIVG